jgi:serine phosphatase RsbU (regulator of sigma subunit)/tetratricopeptide (TPR) repeat protein
MKKIPFFLLIAGCSLLALNISGQSSVEQLEAQLNTAPESDKANIYNQLAQLYFNTDLNKSLESAKSALSSAKTSKNVSDEATAHINLGLANSKLAQYEEAITNFQASLAIHETHSSETGIGYNYIQIGLCYGQLKKSATAMSYFDKAFLVYDGLNDSKGMSHALVSVGEEHFTNGDYKKAIAVYKKAITHDEKTNDKLAMAHTYNMIGSSYSNFGNYELAKSTLVKALALAKESNQSVLTNNIQRNLDVVEGNLRSYQESKSEFQKTEEAKKEEKIQDLEVRSSQLEEKTSDFLSKIATLDEENKIIALLAKVNEDALKQEKMLKEQKAQELELQKKESLIKEAASRAEIEKKNAITIGLIFGLIFLAAIAFLILNRYQQKRKANLQLARQNQEITEQKEEISSQKERLEEQKSQLERTNRQITDSIDYAKRIQNALLSSRTKISTLLPESFILFRPKAVVSGDFYWIKEKNGSILFAAADCTGHGIPGAFMSIVSNNVLNDITAQQATTNPGEILKMASDQIIERLQDKEAQVVESSDGTKIEWEVKDGMDIALCSLKKDSLQLQYAGAHNPLYLIRDGELTEYRGDRLFIGNTTESTVFNTHDISLKKGDMLYVFSDGFADQRGGPENKKFYYQPFQDMLLEIHKKSMEEQQTHLDKVLADWMGNHEQIDDVIIFGVRI